MRLLAKSHLKLRVAVLAEASTKGEAIEKLAKPALITPVPQRPALIPSNLIDLVVVGCEHPLVKLEHDVGLPFRPHRAEIRVAGEGCTHHVLWVEAALQYGEVNADLARRKSEE